MSPRRMTYTRKEAGRLLHRTLRTIVRWEQWGWLTRLPDAPGPEILYAGAQVEALARRLRRIEDGEEDEADTGEPERPRERESSRPKVLPWRRGRPPRAFTPRKPETVAAKPRAAPKPPAGPPRSTPRPPEPTQGVPRSVRTPLISHAPLPSDTEATEWERQIDERKRAWEEQEAAGGVAREDAPPSSASGRR